MPFESLVVVSYSLSIVTRAISLTVYRIFSVGFRIQLHYLLVVVVSDVKVISSTVAVIFAVN